MKADVLSLLPYHWGWGAEYIYMSVYIFVYIYPEYLLGE